MISFNLTTPPQEELSIKWRTKHRVLSLDSPLRRVIPQPIIVETLKLNSRKHFKSFNPQDRIEKISKNSNGWKEMPFRVRPRWRTNVDTPNLPNQRQHWPPYPCSSTGPSLFSIRRDSHDAINEVEASKKEEISGKISTRTKFQPTRRITTSLVSDCDEQETFINLVGNLRQNVNYVPKSVSNPSKGLNYY